MQSAARTFKALAFYVTAAFSENITETPEPGFPAAPAVADPSLHDVQTACVYCAHADAAIFFARYKLACFEYSDVLSDRSLCNTQCMRKIGHGRGRLREDADQSTSCSVAERIQNLIGIHCFFFRFHCWDS
jgi:hypothetical protein